MPTLYSFRDGSEARPDARVTLTFRELRWMFGAYEPAYLSTTWPPPSADAAPPIPARVVVEVTERDGASGPFPRSGFYLLRGLSTARVDELLRHRESHAQRLDDAERWEFTHRRSPARRIPR